MYVLFRDKNWKPSDYFELSTGEKRIVKVFLRQEAEEIKEERRRLNGGGSA